jgi:hypothetical protein
MAMAANPEPTEQTSTPSSPLAAAALAIALYMAVIDAAVETFRSGSPVRWWVVGVVVVYLAASVALWRYRPSLWQRVAWSGRASASFFLLLSLLAFTVWLPGGLTDGLRVAGQSTSRVLSLFTAVVILLAGISVVRLSWLPRWAKIVAGLLAAYGLAAFVTGMVTGAEFAALLHGDSLWTRLPSWLQGAFLGALVVVPAGLLLHAAHMLKAAPSVSRAWDIRQGIAMAMSVLMAASVFNGTGAIGPQPSAAEIVQPVAKSYQELGEALAGPKPTTPPTPDQVADKLEKLFPQLEQAERQIPRDTFDMQAVIDKVGKDPQKLFEWVRDNTYFVPYRGLLRGDKGVLMDRLGNSLDRAMLLYAMLRNIGQPVRLARGTLTEAQAQDVLGKVRPFPSFEERAGSASSTAATDAFVKQYADQNHVDVAKIRRALDQLTAQQEQVKELVQKRVAVQTAMIAAAVGHPPASALAEERADQVRAVTDHWWVQRQNGPTWFDLDPTLPDAQPGKTLTAVQATPAPGTYSDLGQDLLHKVQIKVVIEVWKHGHVSEVPVLTQELLPADLISKRIFLRQIPVAWPQDLSLLEEKNPLERFKQTVLAQTEWLPVLSVGSQNVSRYSFNDYGDLTDSTMPGYMQNVMSGRVLAHKEEEAAAALGNSISGLLSGPRGQQKPPDQQPAAEPERTQVTAEWIDYEIHIPGQPNRTVRREMFDIVGPAVRSAVNVPAPDSSPNRRLDRALALLSDTEILPVGWDLSSAFIDTLVVADLRAKEHALLNFVRDPRTPSPQQDVIEELGKTRFSGRIYDLALARAQLRDFRRDVYFDQLNILSVHRYLKQGEDSGLLFGQAFDIVANHSTGRLGTDGFVDSIEQGALDTVAEGLVATTCREGTSCSPVANVSEALATQNSWLTLRDSGDSSWPTLDVTTDVRYRIKVDLGSGYVVLIPGRRTSQKGGRFTGWWRMDPRTGETLGIGERGWGQTATETSLTHSLEHALEHATVEAFFMTASYLICRLPDCVDPPEMTQNSVPKCLFMSGIEGTLGYLTGYSLVAFMVGEIVELYLMSREGPGYPRPTNGESPCPGDWRNINPGPEPNSTNTPHTANPYKDEDSWQHRAWPRGIMR